MRGFPSWRAVAACALPDRPCWPPADADHLLVSAAQMAALEEELFASGLPVPALMEKAALAIAGRLRRRLEAVPWRPQAVPWRHQAVAQLRWPRANGVLVLVGPGHNGGDGLVIARELHLAGLAVRLWTPFERHRPLTADHLRHARWLGLPLLDAPPDPGDGALWVDALFGIGQNRPPGEALELLLEQRQQQRPGRLVAVDGPTGLCADSGRLLGSGGATAALTWSIGLLKRGFVQDSALARVGHLERIELGLNGRSLQPLVSAVPRVLRERDAVLAPWPDLDPAASKYGRGRVLLVAGSRRYRGAAALALAGAGASGCGSLRAALPQEVAEQLWMVAPQAVLEAALPSGGAGELQLAALAALDLTRLDALLLGPGLGVAEAGEPGSDPALAAADPAADGDGWIWDRLQRFAGLLVLDADGLNRLVRRCGAAPGGSGRAGAADWLGCRQGPTWITPHRGEFNRLFPELAAAEPLEAARQAALSCGSTVLLKGARSVVAAADGRCWQVLEAAPEAARAGLGDTLAGYAAGRGAMAMAALAAGRPEVPLDGALLAAVALEHASAGRRCRRSAGAGGASPLAVAAALAQHSR